MQLLVNYVLGIVSQIWSIGNLLLLLFNYMLLSLIILNAWLAGLERPNRRIDQVHNAAFPWFPLSK